MADDYLPGFDFRAQDDADRDSAIKKHADAHTSDMVFDTAFGPAEDAPDDGAFVDLTGYVTVDSMDVVDGSDFMIWA